MKSRWQQQQQQQKNARWISIFFRAKWWDGVCVCVCVCVVVDILCGVEAGGRAGGWCWVSAFFCSYIHMVHNWTFPMIYTWMYSMQTKRIIEKLKSARICTFFQFLFTLLMCVCACARLTSSMSSLNSWLKCIMRQHLSLALYLSLSLLLTTTMTTTVLNRSTTNINYYMRAYK